MVAITPLPTPPSTTDPTNFNTRADAFLAALATFANEVNNIGLVISAGGLISIPFTFSTTTTDSDPGAGVLRLNNATQNASTVIRADLLASSGGDWTATLDSLDDSTSTVKGFILLFKTSDATKYLLFSVSAVASPSGYRNVTVACVASSASSPFANSDAITMQFSRNGDKGDTGANGTSSLDFSSSGTGNVTPPSAPASNCVGYLCMPRNPQNNDYTFVIGDLGKLMYHSSGSSHTWTIPPYSSVPWPDGASIAISNQGNFVAIARGAGVSLQLAGVGGDAVRYVNQYGLATLTQPSQNVWVISGAGVP